MFLGSFAGSYIPLLWGGAGFPWRPFSWAGPADFSASGLATKPLCESA